MKAFTDDESGLTMGTLLMLLAVAAMFWGIVWVVCDQIINVVN